MRKRMFALLLAAAMLLALAACGGGESGTESPGAAAPTPTSPTGASPEPLDEELQKAIDLGLVPELLQTDYEAQITYREFCSVLDRLIATVRPECLSAWETASANYRNADEKMSRTEGALVFLYAAESAGLDALGYQYNLPLEDFPGRQGDFYEGATWDYPLLPDIKALYYNETLAESEDYSWRCEYPYTNNAVWFVEYFSYGNGKTYFDYDERHSLNLGEAFRRGDAIRAVERLYETARFYVYQPVEELHATLPAETLMLAAAMRPASCSHLPDWKGYTIVDRSWSVTDRHGISYEKEEIDTLARLGFDFVRAPLNFNSIFSGTDTSRANPAFLRTMDDLLTWCAEAGIHVCFDLHDMPGFYTAGDDTAITLFFDGETQRLFVDFWRFLAEYYKDVPSNLLSFNLLNEPHSAVEGEVTDASYSALMLQAIDAIRAVTPERLIFADMIDFIAGEPVSGLVESGVAQAFHPYFLGDSTRAYPTYTISGFVQSSNGRLTLQGDFPAGTVLQLEIRGFHAQGTLSLTDGKHEISALALGNEAVGEGGCVQIAEQGTGGECRFYGGLVWETTLPDAVSSLAISCDTGWYLLDYIRVHTSGREYALLCDRDKVASEQVPKLTLEGDGTIRADKAETLVFFDREALADSFARLTRFRAETGIQIMAQEFGFHPAIPSAVALAGAEDILSVFEECEIPWCSWADGFGPLLDQRIVDWNALWEWGGQVTREGAEYERLSENWTLDAALIEVFQKHME